MIHSPGRRYLFVHIPKTGGTALTLALEGRAMRDDLIVADTPKGRARRGRLRGLHPAGRLWKHSTLDDLAGVIDEAALDGLFVLTLVRNPWDRMVSYYHWLRQQGFAQPAVGLARSLSFSAFLNHPATVAALAASPYARHTTRAGHDRARLFARIEVPEDLDPFWSHLGFRLILPRANETTRPRDWRPFYSARDSELIARLCAADIARSGYRFDP